MDRSSWNKHVLPTLIRGKNTFGLWPSHVLTLFRCFLSAVSCSFVSISLYGPFFVRSPCFLLAYSYYQINCNIMHVSSGADLAGKAALMALTYAPKHTSWWRRRITFISITERMLPLAGSAATFKSCCPSRKRTGGTTCQGKTKIEIFHAFAVSGVQFR